MVMCGGANRVVGLVLRRNSMFSERALVRLPGKNVRYELTMREHSQYIVAGLIDALAHYVTPLYITLKCNFLIDYGIQNGI